MESDWSVAAGADDPVIEAPWSDVTSGLAWMDLRVDAELQRERIMVLSEVAAAPALARALMRLNALSGLLLTAKCDRWPMSEAELMELADILDAPSAACGYGSYIDVLMAHSVPMSDFLLHEEWARMAARRCAALDESGARTEMVVRPAHKDRHWGFGISVYCYAGGLDKTAAEATWSKTLEQIIPIVIVAAEALLPSPDEIRG